MSRTFYSIVGPTGSGKTGVVLQAAENLLQTGAVGRVAIVSADSRQVYKGLEVITGADIPSEFFKESSCFRHKDLNLTIFGVASISPFDEWSAAHFSELLQSVLTEYSQPNDRVFVVGGTMLYQQIVDRPELAELSGPLTAVRKKAVTMTVGELQNWLTSIDKSVLDTMNNSDKNNPRRLVRAIERGLSPVEDVPSTPPDWQHEWFGVMPDKDLLAENIARRVVDRFENGAKEEAMELRARIEEQGLNSRKLPAWTSCGVPYLDAFLGGEITQQQCLEEWTAAELRYVKRQLTWWKKQTNITWCTEKADLLNKLLHL